MLKRGRNTQCTGLRLLLYEYFSNLDSSTSKKIMHSKIMKMKTITNCILLLQLITFNQIDGLLDVLFQLQVLFYCTVGENKKNA